MGASETSGYAARFSSVIKGGALKRLGLDGLRCPIVGERKDEKPRGDFSGELGGTMLSE